MTDLAILSRQIISLMNLTEGATFVLKLDRKYFEIDYPPRYWWPQILNLVLKKYKVQIEHTHVEIK